ncbi:MAG: hypothetical protein IT237_10550 [Bacteroidia bacterium]|nr:hypothetical protein [Bacteroidia bacterium]
MKIGLCTIFMLFVVIMNAQETPATAPLSPKPHDNLPEQRNTNADFPSLKDRLYLGGNFGAWFGNTTYVNVSPLLGCRITKKFSLGVTGTYNYYSYKAYNQKYVSTVYGGGVFARYLILENLFAQVAWERLSVPDYRSVLPEARVYVDNILVGGGFRQQFSDRGSFIAAIFYNINQTPLSPYQNPIVQIGFNVGL